ncbi:MAG: hypothetical protein JSU07_05370 [Bacteroidetes bacterium]|nr:hypothetical protein [Bacteroidota bacterium]
MNFFKYFLPFLFFTLVKAQLPETDIWLLKVNNSKNNYNIQSAKNITNRKGYDNQPAFSINDKLIYFSSSYNDNKTDIYTYSISKEKTNRITLTDESEYSPTPINYTLLASVVVEKDSTQRIHLISEKKTEKILPIDSVGYFIFLNQDSVIYYKLTQPHSLKIYSISKNKEAFIANFPGKSFKKINQYSFVYTLNDTIIPGYYYYDFKVHKARVIALEKNPSNVIAYNEMWGLLKANGSKIERFNQENKSWDLLFNLEKFGITNISRFCFSNNLKYLAVVNNNN